MTITVRGTGFRPDPFLGVLDLPSKFGLDAAVPCCCTVGVLDALGKAPVFLLHPVVVSGSVGSDSVRRERAHLLLLENPACPNFSSISGSRSSTTRG